MTKRPPTDVGAPAFNRLKALTRSPGQDFNLTLIRYACERLLYRLSQSPHSRSFVLKGATLFVVWEDEPHRATRDIDLLGFGEDSAERLRAVFGSREAPCDGAARHAEQPHEGYLRRAGAGG